MERLAILFGVGGLMLACAVSHAAEPQSPLDFKVKTIGGQETDLSQYKGKVVLIVNVASRCGNTKQYKPLESLYSKYKDQGFVVLGFPANEFGKQEPGTDAEIQKFCTDTYNVDFPMFSKIIVKGEGIAPVYEFLTTKSDAKFAGPIPWNFEKFLIGRDGKVVARIPHKTSPDAPAVVQDIESELAKKAS